MKNQVFITLIGAFCLVLVTKFAYGQDEIQPKKYDNPQWKRVVYMDYKPGKYGRAQEIIYSYYRKAAEKAGTMPPKTIEFETGEWDVLLIWDLADGIESLNWDVSPNGIAWRKALNEIMGGEEKAAEIISEYQSLIARSKSNIGRALD
jgi:hypothetical protein